MSLRSDLLIDCLIFRALRDAGITKGMSHLNKNAERKKLEEYIERLEIQVETQKYIERRAYNG